MHIRNTSPVANPNEVEATNRSLDKDGYKTMMKIRAKMKIRNNDGNILHFEIMMLNDCEMETDAVQNRGDCTIVERADAPTAKQIAVIWVSKEDVTLDIQGVWIKDQAGRMTEMKSWKPQLNGACFPILYPRSTTGWRSYIKKNRGSKKNCHEQMEFDIGMQRPGGVDDYLNDKLLDEAFSLAIQNIAAGNSQCYNTLEVGAKRPRIASEQADKDAAHSDFLERIGLYAGPMGRMFIFIENGWQQ